MSKEIRKEVVGRESGRKQKIDESQDAYPKETKSWDFGRYDRKEKTDQSRFSMRFWRNKRGKKK